MNTINNNVNIYNDDFFKKLPKEVVLRCIESKSKYDLVVYLALMQHTSTGFDDGYASIDTLITGMNMQHRKQANIRRNFKRSLENLVQNGLISVEYDFEKLTAQLAFEFTVLNTFDENKFFGKVNAFEYMKLRNLMGSNNHELQTTLGVLKLWAYLKVNIFGDGLYHGRSIIGMAEEIECHKNTIETWKEVGESFSLFYTADYTYYVIRKSKKISPATIWLLDKGNQDKAIEHQKENVYKYDEIIKCTPRAFMEIFTYKPDVEKTNSIKSLKCSMSAFLQHGNYEGAARVQLELYEIKEIDRFIILKSLDNHMQKDEDKEPLQREIDNLLLAQIRNKSSDELLHIEKDIIAYHDSRAKQVRDIAKVSIFEEIFRGNGYSNLQENSDSWVEALEKL